MSKKNLTIGGVIAVLLAAYLGFDFQEKNTTTQKSEQPNIQNSQLQDNASVSQQGTQIIENAFSNKLSDVQVQTQGKVRAILPDDNEGSRHQKFILELSNGQTILIAHNIDLAPRIENIKKGDTVAFNGEYEYSQKGGVVHWTHKDPKHRHIDGWLNHNGKIYQ